MTLYLRRISSAKLHSKKGRPCHTRKMTRHVAAVSYTVADLFGMQEGSSYTGSLTECTEPHKTDQIES